MKSEMHFRGVCVEIRADAQSVCLRLDTGRGGPPVYLGAEAAALIGSELERAALYVQRLNRNRAKVEGLASYVEKYHAKGADHAGA